MELTDVIARARLITNHCNEILNDSKLYCKEVKINFRVDDTSGSRGNRNANVKKLSKSKHEYDVVIYVGLIEFLYNKIDDILSIFFNFKTNEQKNAFKVFIFDIWIYLVLFHEYGHIISGHLQYIGVNQWLEFDENRFSNNKSLSSEYRYAMELEADLWSGKLCLSYLAEYYKNINVCLSRDENNSKIWDDFFLMIIMLMYSFENNTNATHPPSLSRTMTILIFIHDAINAKPELQNILPDISHLTPKYITNNIVNYLKKDVRNIFKDFSKDLEIVSSVKSNIEEMGLSKFRLTKESF